MLEIIAWGVNDPGRACGDGSRNEYYACNDCNAKYRRMDCDDWNPMDYERTQETVYACDEWPPSEKLTLTKKGRELGLAGD